MNEDTQETTRPKALPGIWTPWATVLCYDAHGPKFHDKTIPADDFARLCTPQTFDPEWNRITICDETGQRIFVRVDVAILNNLRHKLDGAFANMDIGLSQTGGMCSALEIHPTNDPKWIICITDGEIDSDDDTGSFLICRYDFDEWNDGEIKTWHTIGTATSINEAADLISVHMFVQLTQNRQR